MSTYPKGKGPRCPHCETNEIRDRASIKCGACNRSPGWHLPKPPAEKVAPLTLAEDRAAAKQAAEIAALKARYKESIRTIDAQERTIDAIKALQADRDSVTITPRQGQGTSEGTLVALASDWHVEERVGAEVGALNRYSLEIAEARASRFFQSLVRLTRLLQQDIQIEQMVVGLLGDYITGNIHGEENAERNALTPNEAIVFAQTLLIGGIDCLLTHTKLAFTFMCHSGNHARTTQKTRFGAENGHSLEYLLFLFLANHYRGESRCTFVIPEGMHSYLEVYGTTIRFQHGHAIKYGGGVGGIYIPVHKAIANWNRGRHADLDCFGHFHQQVDGGNFLCNGSLIGYNAFALSIKAPFEPPRQTLFLMDKKRGRTCNWPVFVEDPPAARRRAA